MNKAAFYSAGRLDVEMFINRFRLQRFVFTAEDLPFNVTGFQWQLVIKENEGAIPNLLSLSIGSGLSFPIYETNVIEARFESVQTKIQQGCKYWALIRTDTNEIWLNGHIVFGYGPFDSSGSEQDVNVNLSNATVEVQLQAIVYVTESGTSFEIVNYTAFEASGLPTGVAAGYIARIVTTDPDYLQTIDGVQYFNNKIIYFDGTNWISWSGDYGATT